VLVLGGAPASAGQTTSVSAEPVGVFVASARAATERYRDQAAAVADGYRRIGPDFPSMGEHWLSLALAVRPNVDPLHPPILEYITVAGRPILAGVAYTQLVHGDLSPTPIPAPGEAWHYHQGTVDEESFILSHAGRTIPAGDPGLPRVGVLHAWLWLENPAGVFATDNWALPWYRLGLAAPAWSSGASPGAFAAALAGGGEHYFATLLRLREHLTAAQNARVAGVLERHAREVRMLLLTDAHGTLPGLEVELGRAWSGVETDLNAVCSSCALSEPEHHR
jgi:hypothetical protein